MNANINKTEYTLRVAIVALLFVFLSSAAQASEITSDNVIKYVNLAREAQGLDHLYPNDKLMQAAEDKLDDMISNGYFAHTSPAGVTPWHWFKEEKYDYRFAGENLAINFVTAEVQQSAWMKSPTHRKNILDPNFKEIGVAVGKRDINGQVSIITVQEFGATLAGIGTDGKNFSPFNDSGLRKESGKVIPQVLSVQDVSLKNAKKEGLQGISQKYNDGNKVAAIENLSGAVLVVLMFSIALAAAAFLAVAADKTFLILENIRLRSKSESVNL